MDYKNVLEQAKKTIGPNCKVCPECNGLGCGNTMPGPGSKAPGNGAYDNWKAWRKIKLNMDVIAPSCEVDTSTEFLGRQLQIPIITGPIGSIKWQYNPTDDVRDFNKAVVDACVKSGILGAFGDGIQPEVYPDSIAYSALHGGVSMPIFNPYSDEEILEKVASANKFNPYAIGLVIDSAGLPHLRAKNINAGTKTIEQLKTIKSACNAPFLVKGIMTAKSAEKAIEAGADAIIVSNHGGRVLPDSPATAEVLPEIVNAVKGRAKIIVDGGIRTGIDIFKALAIGADAVMICRPILISWYGAGSEGIEIYVQKLKDELSDIMYMCGARKISDINRDMIRFY